MHIPAKPQAIRKTNAALARRHFLLGTALAACAPVTSFSIPAEAPGGPRVTAEPVVETAYGKVRGYVNHGVFTFRGIRYGASTIGKNRFLPPKKPDPWAGIRDATGYGCSAPQTNPASRGLESTPGLLDQLFAASDGYRAAPA